MLGNRPDDTRLRFGVALEYLKAGRTEDGVRELRRYLAEADDEGNGWGRLGAALVELGRDDEAMEAFQAGIRAAGRDPRTASRRRHSPISTRCIASPLTGTPDLAEDRDQETFL
jgi:predicted Zn-dependent protease